MSSTKSVQGIIRTLIWVLVFAPLTAVFAYNQFFDALNIWPESAIYPYGILAAKLAVFALISTLISGMFYILPEWDRLSLLRLGRFSGVRGPGVFLIWPLIYSIASIVDTRVRTREVSAAETLTEDNVPVTVTAAIEYEVVDVKKATIDVKNYLESVEWVATEALKNTIGQINLKKLLGERDEIAKSLKEEIDKNVEDFGVNVRAVRITDIGTPPKLVEELAVIARAERSAKAKNIEANAEIEVAFKLDQAVQILEQREGSMKLREIQALLEMSKEESATIIIYPWGDPSGASLAQATAGAQTVGLATPQE